MGAFDDLNGGGGAFADLVDTKPMSRGAKVAKGATDPIEGAAQLLTHVLPDSVVRGGNALNNWLADKTGLVAKIPDGGMDALVADNEKAYQARRTAAGESGFDGYRMLGNVVSPANAVLAAKLPQAASTAGRIASGMVGGGISALSNPVTDGDFWGEKGQQAATGALFGGTVPAVTSMGARLISPKASVSPELALLKSEGVKPTIGQSLGGWANAMEEKAQSLPIVGDVISMARQRAREQFNNAAINRATAPIGVKIEGSGHQAVAEAGDAISSVYNQAKAALGGFKLDDQANSQLSNLRMLATSGLQGRERSTVNGYFKDYLNRPGLTAESFKELDSKLTADIAKFGKGDAYQQKVADALKEVQSIITENAKRANPEAAALFAKADKAWANLVRVEGASVGAKGTGGVFTPGQLNTAVRQADSSVRDRATARGKALMQDLSSAGQNVLGNKIPDSGTAGRLFLGGLGIGSGAINPAIPIGLATGAAAYTPPVQSLLRGMFTSRPDAAQPIADAFRKSAPLLTPAGAQIGLGLLN